MGSVAKRILLLDDDYESMLPFKLHLEFMHSAEVELTAAQTLLERLAHERFDLICVDYSIHPVSLDEYGEEVQNIHFANAKWHNTGRAFIERLRAGEFNRSKTQGTPSTVPVIVLSAVANDPDNHKAALIAQISDYVEKPFDPEALAQNIMRIVGAAP